MNEEGIDSKEINPALESEPEKETIKYDVSKLFRKPLLNVGNPERESGKEHPPELKTTRCSSEDITFRPSDVTTLTLSIKNNYSQ